MRRERCARLFADSLHNVEHAWRKAGLGREIGHHRASQRRPLGWFDDGGIAGCETWTYFPRGQHERSVPWCDERGDAGWIEAHVIDDFWRVDLFVVQLERAIGEVLDVMRRARDHPPDVPN